METLDWHLRWRWANYFVPPLTPDASPEERTAQVNAEAQMRELIQEIWNEYPDEDTRASHLVSLSRDRWSPVPSYVFVRAHSVWCSALARCGNAGLEELASRLELIPLDVLDEMDALVSAGDASIPHMKKLLSTGRGIALSRAIEVLGRIGNASIVPDLVTWLDDRVVGEETACSTSMAFSMLGDFRAVPGILAALSRHSGSRDSCYCFCEALKSLRGCDGLPRDYARQIKKALRDHAYLYRSAG